MINTKKVFLFFGIHTKFGKIWITKRLETIIWSCFIVLSIYKYIA